MADLTLPAHMWVPPRDGTAGQEAVELAASVGWRADPEQSLMLDSMLSERAGKWAAFETCVVEPRQNGKTDSGQAAGLHDLFIRKVSRVVWTAHKYKTTSDSFNWFASVCENYDHLSRRVYRIQFASGEQSIQLLPRHTGPRMDFLARATGGGRGLDGDVVNLDEALYLTPTMMGALLPILSAKADPQVRYFSSSGVLASEVLRGLRDRGRAGGDPSLAYLEWCAAPGECATPDCTHALGLDACVFDDEARWKAANPALDRRITREYVRAERRALAVRPIEFARERMGWWEDPTTDAADNALAAWPDRADPSAAPTDRLAYAVDVAPSLSSSAIAVCGSWTTGECVEVTDHGSGSAWVPGRVAEMVAKRGPLTIGLVKGSPAEALLPDLEAIAGVTAVALTAAETTAACSTFARAVTDGTVAHRDDPRLNAAVGSARRKFAGDGWRWTRIGSDGDITCLYAVAVARALHVAAMASDYNVLDSIPDMSEEVPA